MLKDQPKWSDPKERLRTLIAPTPDSTYIAEGDGGSLIDNTSNFKRLIGRKVEKANGKNKAIEKDVGEYLAKKMQFIEESQEQEKEGLRIKVEKVCLEELRDWERIQLEEHKIRIEEGKIGIEREKLCIQNMLDERIMLVDTIALARAQKLFYEQL
nr:hypothetical protein CFP56_55344 [Quercus suber]